MRGRERINLKDDTLKQLEAHGKTPDDVRWVGQVAPTLRELVDVQRSGVPWNPWRVTWAQFARLADFDYPDGYIGPHVNEKLVVVGDDWWLERGEYDGSEWWAFKTKPATPTREIGDPTADMLRNKE